MISGNLSRGSVVITRVFIGGYLCNVATLGLPNRGDPGLHEGAT
jgi:hypothetical protein